jgi:hypothetical protein
MADVGFATPGKPAEVWDVVTQKPVAFEYTDGWVKINNLKLGPYTF